MIVIGDKNTCHLDALLNFLHEVSVISSFRSSKGISFGKRVLARMTLACELHERLEVSFNMIFSITYWLKDYTTTYRL